MFEVAVAKPLLKSNTKEKLINEPDKQWFYLVASPRVFSANELFVFERH